MWGKFLSPERGIDCSTVRRKGGRPVSIMKWLKKKAVTLQGKRNRSLLGGAVGIRERHEKTFGGFDICLEGGEEAERRGCEGALKL